MKEINNISAQRPPKQEISSNNYSKSKTMEPYKPKSMQITSQNFT